MKRLKNKLNYKHILVAGLSVLLSCYLAIIVVDFLNLANSRELINHLTVPIMWNLLFQEAGIIEFAQWLALGLFIIVSGYIAGYQKSQKELKSSLFWLWLSIAGFLMLMEDTVDVRNYLLRGSIEWGWQTLNVLETVYFLMLALVPLYAIIRYGESIKESKITIYLLALAFVFYGSAAFISGPADLTSFNYYLAEGMYEATASLGGEELRDIYEQTDKKLDEITEGNYMAVNYRLVDFLVEESLEYLGALMFLVSAFSYLEGLRATQEE